ncbi:MAG: hypothetical protein ACOYMV_10390 [Verrucomicrobiia bacterium]
MSIFRVHFLRDGERASVLVEAQDPKKAAAKVEKPGIRIQKVKLAPERDSLPVALTEKQP